MLLFSIRTGYVCADGIEIAKDLRSVSVAALAVTVHFICFTFDFVSRGLLSAMNWVF